MSDAEIGLRLNEPEQVVGLEIQGILTELGFRTRTHAIVYVLAREISSTSRDHRPRAPSTEDMAAGEAHETAGPGATEERPA